jgi:hypothetical protein
MKASETLSDPELRPLPGSQTSRPPVSLVDGRPALREWIFGNLEYLIAEAESACRSAENGDDTGLRYHVRRLIAHARQVAGATKDLRTVNEAPLSREQAA